MSDAPKKHRGGRPTKFTEATKTKLIDSIGKGHYYQTACRLAGVSYAQFRDWIIEGEQDLKAGKSTPKSKFSEQITQAEAKAVDVALSHWIDLMGKDYRAARDFLARRHPQDWGKQDKEPVHSAQLDSLSDEDLEKIARGEDV